MQGKVTRGVKAPLVAACLAAAVVVGSTLVSGQPAAAQRQVAGSTTTPTPTSTGSPAPGSTSSPSVTDPAKDPKAAAKAAAQAAAQAAQDAEDTAALLSASAALAGAEADLVTAQQALADAKTRLAAAQTADQLARTEAQAAALAEERATRDLDAVAARIALRERDLGRLASSAYRSNGPMGEWAIVLSSTTPDQLADRLAFLQNVGTAGNEMIARLREDRADLINTRASLDAARRRLDEAQVAAAKALAAVQTETDQAAAAAAQVSTVVAARQAALDATQKAIREDKRQTGVFVAYSGELEARIVQAAAALAKGKNSPHGTGRMVLPGLGVVTSPYGLRYHPILHYVKMHTGIDFGAADGIVYAADDGVVLFTEFNEAYGNMTVVDHGTVGGLHLTTLYAHQAAFAVKPGDRVVKGQAIGVIGSTGFATGPHLHFEVRINGQTLDPAPFLAGAKPPVSAGQG